MNVTYTGKHGELPPDQQKKLDAKFAKISKLIPWKGEKEAHVAVTTERHQMHAEFTLNFYDHPLVGEGNGPDFFTAMCGAAEKLEQQAIKLRAKWRDGKRVPKEQLLEDETSVNGAAPPKAKQPAVQRQEQETRDQPRIFRVNHAGQKPMTLDEAMIEIDGHDYMVYRDAERDCVSVLIRRKDGGFDLIES
jgi:ribosomal subunit interface protein